MYNLNFMYRYHDEQYNYTADELKEEIFEQLETLEESYKKLASDTNPIRIITLNARIKTAYGVLEEAVQMRKKLLA